MISYFRAKNFRSIADAALDFRYGERKAPNGWREASRLPFLEEKGVKNGRFVPCLAIFGANANGKSNLLKAVAQLQTMVDAPGVDVRQLYDPNLIQMCEGPTELTLGFVKAGAEYVYRVSYDSTSVTAERLERNGTALYTATKEARDFSKLVMPKSYTKKRLEDIFTVENCDGAGRWIRPLLNTFGHHYAGLNAAVAAAFCFITLELHVFFHNSEAWPLPMAVENLTRVMACDQATALAKIVEIIRKCDVDIKRLDIVECEPPMSPRLPGSTDIVRHDTVTDKKVHYTIHSTHLNNRKELVVFDFMRQESEGTIRLAALVAHCLCVVHLGLPIFIDELDRSLHPLLVRAVLSFFVQRIRNKNNAQIVFTTHCADLLDDESLRLSEIAIVTKNLHYGTKVKRLCEYRAAGEDIRNVTNFRRHYLDGFYSGIPYPVM